MQALYILQNRKLRLREVKQLAKQHKREWNQILAEAVGRHSLGSCGLH
jgi:hypothetical protein